MIPQSALAPVDTIVKFELDCPAMEIPPLTSPLTPGSGIKASAADVYQEAAPYLGRVTPFEFQYRDGDASKTIFSGTSPGDRFQNKFALVEAQEFRLNMLDATEGPTIAEIEKVVKRP